MSNTKILVGLMPAATPPITQKRNYSFVSGEHDLALLSTGGTGKLNFQEGGVEVMSENNNKVEAADLTSDGKNNTTT